MRPPERSRRISSIPPRTSIDVLREGGFTIRIGGGSFGGVGRVSREATAREVDWSQTVARQNVFQKPSGREKARLKPLPERNGRIEWEAEVIEDYNGQGDLGIILQFAGIELTKAPFLRSKHNRPDSPIFYIPIDYKSKIARLFLATKGDTFESQIVPDQMDVNPFFQEELYLPQLATTHDPISMTVFQNNRMVTIGYNPRTC